MSYRSDYIIEDARQLEAISDPTRQQLVSLLEELREASVAELAERLGRTTESLYHHIRLLERVGLIYKERSEPSGRRFKAIYRLPGRRLRINPEIRTPKYVAALQKAARALFRLAERLGIKALADDRCRLTGPRTNFRMQQLSARLDREGVKKLNRLLAEIDQLMLEREPANNQTLYTVTYCYTPVYPD